MRTGQDRPGPNLKRGRLEGGTVDRFSVICYKMNVQLRQGFLSRSTLTVQCEAIGSHGTIERRDLVGEGLSMSLGAHRLRDKFPTLGSGSDVSLRPFPAHRLEWGRETRAGGVSSETQGPGAVRTVARVGVAGCCGTP